jgi:carboxymethylenebutenolidase
MTPRGSMTRMTMSDGASIGVYQVQPKGERRGGLVLIQEIFGITEHIKEQADRFADQGYEVLAPAIFDREAPGFQASYEPEDREKAMKLAKEAHPFALSVADAITCIDALKERGKVFMAGYCYGGTVTWATVCKSPDLAAASAYYGGQIPAMAQQQPKAPVILHFGKLDTSIPMEGVEKVKAAHPGLPVYVYEGAGHGFQSDRRKDYHPESAKLAWERTLDLFRRNA